MTMKAAVWYSNRDIRLEEQPLRRPNDREMLVKVMACGICGSDVVEWYRLPRARLRRDRFSAGRPGLRCTEGCLP
jgi:L-iditol 2-dehydrogenase